MLLAVVDGTLEAEIQAIFIIHPQASCSNILGSWINPQGILGFLFPDLAPTTPGSQANG
jgi:hypothetical protein